MARKAKAPGLGFRIWDFIGIWGLEFGICSCGIWDLEFGILIKLVARSAKPNQAVPKDLAMYPPIEPGLVET